MLLSPNISRTCAHRFDGTPDATLANELSAVHERSRRPGELHASYSLEANAPRRRLLVICFSNLSEDPRVQRQLRALSAWFDITAAGFSDPRIAGVDFVPLSSRYWSLREKAILALMLKARMYERAYWSAVSVRSALVNLQTARFDLILANDLNTLPLALRLAGTTPVVLDAHEFAPAEFEDVWRWRFFFRRHNEYLCARYIPHVAGMITVSDGIAAAYRERYGVEVSVVPNTPEYALLEPSEVAPDTIRLIHHGAAIPSRRIELMIELADLLDPRFHLDLVLVPTVPAYHKTLCALAAHNPRIRILPPLPMRDLVNNANAYDIGLILYPPNSLNMRHALPNKFFEFIHARIGIALGPSVEMAPLAHRFGCGVIAPDFTPVALAGVMNRLTREQVVALKRGADMAARELCYENNAGVLLRTVQSALSQR
jgi:hypothetical protein